MSEGDLAVIEGTLILVEAGRIAMPVCGQITGATIRAMLEEIRQLRDLEENRGPADCGCESFCDQCDQGMARCECCKCSCEKCLECKEQ